MTDKPRILEHHLRYPMLTARNSEQFYYHNEMPPQDCYAVMLQPTPAMPGQPHEECSLFSVLCCGKYITLDTSPNESKWGWVELGADTRVLIGDDLLEMNAEPGRWYYLTLSGGFAVQQEGAADVSIKP